MNQYNSGEGTSRLYVDMTTTWQERGRIPHGTTRVERGIIAALAGMDVPNLQLCRYDRRLQRFFPVASGEALEIATAEQLSEVRRQPASESRLDALFKTGKRIEAWVRRNVRDRLRARRIDGAVPDKTAPFFASGSTLLLPGELQRQDFAVLMRLKRQLALRLAFVFYDLLGVLPVDDPRLRDPAAYDLPSSDFIVREADVVLAISDTSRQILLDHMAVRGVTAPRVEVIRLGHLVRSGAINAAPPHGLRSGEFVLTVGDIVPRKNHALLISVWQRLLRQRPAALKPLVIVGRGGADSSWLTNQIGADAALRRNVHILSNADDRQLDWLYTNCLFTVFPSVLEGYGLPVAESLAAGKVCVASSSSAIPEASQGFGIHLDPNDLESWITEIDRLLVNPAELERETRRIAGFRPLTWSDTVADIMRFLGVSFPNAQSEGPAA